jgi:MtrB/PioB family decaheme-associated outer membrane protein
MRITRVNLLWLISTALLPAFILPQSQTLYAQEAGERGYIEVGVRQLAGERDSSKFTEYRDLPSGFFLQRAEVRLNDLLNDKFFFNYKTRKANEQDQSHLLSAGRHGKFRVQFRWDQTPHYFSNTARSFFIESGRGVYTVPAAMRARLVTTPGEITSFLEGAGPIHPRLRRNLGGGGLTLTPTAAWTLLFQYANEKQSGARPFGTTTNSFTHVVELPEPIDYLTQQVSASAEYIKRGSGIQFGYTGSFFTNKVSELVWDIPFKTSDAVNNGSRGRLDLYPNNSAQNVSVAGALNLPMATRFMASFTPGWMRQNDAFLPFTTNTAITNVPALPATSLHGQKSTLAMNYTLTSSAIKHLPLTVRYRSYDYDNDTPSLTFSDYVRADGALGGVARRNLPYAFNRQNLEASVSWDFLKKSVVKFGYEWEGFERVHRDASNSNEHTVAAALDLNLKKWCLFRTSYRHAEREPKHYEANEESFPFGEPATALGQIEGLRKFDEAARGQDRAEVLLQVDATDTVSFSASYGTTQNDYKRSAYGMLKDINYNFTFDLVYSPYPAFSLFADYTREKFKYSQRSRQRNPPSATAPANDSANNDWTSDIRDLIDTWEAGIEGVTYEKRLRYEAYYNLASAKGTTLARALGVPGSTGFLVTTAQDYPNTSDRFHQVVGSVRLKLRQNLYPKVEYRFERYGRTDFQIERLSPYMGTLDASTNTSIFLGADVPGYRAHVVTFSLGYIF